MIEISEFRKQYPQYNDINDVKLTKLLHNKYYSDMPIEDFGAKFVPQPKSPNFLVELKGEFQKGVQQDIQKLSQGVESARGFVAGLKEKWPQIAGSTVATLIPLAPNLIPGAQATPEELLTIPAGQAAGRAITAALGRTALASFGGAIGKTGQEIYKTTTGQPQRAKNIWQAIDRISGAAEEEMWGQITGEIAAPVIGKALAPFAQTVIPNAPEMSRQIGRAARRIPQQELAQLPASLQKTLTAKSIMPRFYKNELGRWVFGRPPKYTVLMTPAEKTVSPALDWIENAIEGSIFGGGRIKLQKGYLQPLAMKQLTKETVDNFWELAGRRMSNREVADFFADAITDSREAWRVQQRIMYKQIDDIINLPVSTKRAKDIASEILEQAESGLGSAPARQRVANRILKKWKDSPSFAKAIDYRSDLLEEVRKYESLTGLKSPKLRGDSERLAAALDTSMSQIAKAHSDEAYTAWRNANKFTQQGYEQFSRANLENALRFARKNPSKVAGEFFQPYSAESVQELKKLVPDDVFKSMRASWLEQQMRRASSADGMLLGKNFKTSMSEQALGKDTIKEIFPEPNLYKNLMQVSDISSILQEKTGAGGKMVMQLTQSGEVIMTIAQAVSGQKPKTGLVSTLILSPLIMSRVLTTQTGSKLLAEGFKTPIGSPQAAGLVTRILKLTKGPEPISPIADWIKKKKWRGFDENNKGNNE